MPGGTFVGPGWTLFRLVMPGQAWWDLVNLVGPGQTLGMPGGTSWDPGDAFVGHFHFLPAAKPTGLGEHLTLILVVKVGCILIYHDKVLT